MIQKGGEIFTKARIRTILLVIIGLVVLGAGLKGKQNIKELQDALKKYALSYDLENRYEFYVRYGMGCTSSPDNFEKLHNDRVEEFKFDFENYKTADVLEDDEDEDRVHAEHLEGKHFHSSNPYKVLNIDPSALLSDIKKAYRDLSRKEHPDKNRSNKVIANRNMILITAAYEKLTDKNNEEYDEFVNLKQRFEDNTNNLKSNKSAKISGFCAMINQIYRIYRQIFSKGDSLLMVCIKYGGLAIGAGLAAKAAANGANHVLDAAVETIYYTINNSSTSTKSGDIKILIPPAIKNNDNMSQLSLVKDFK